MLDALVARMQLSANGKVDGLELVLELIHVGARQARQKAVQ